MILRPSQTRDNHGVGDILGLSSKMAVPSPTFDCDAGFRTVVVKNLGWPSNSTTAAVTHVNRNNTDDPLTFHRGAKDHVGTTFCHHQPHFLSTCTALKKITQRVAGRIDVPLQVY